MSIASPKQELVTGRAVELRLRVRPGVRLEVTVGTTNVTGRLGPARNGVRRARLRRGVELARGLNHIGVRARSGRRGDFDSVPVVVARRHRGFLTLVGATRRATPVVRARWRSAPRNLRARLNGRPVGREFVSRSGIPKVAQLGPEDGLRFGRNRLVVTAYDRAGRFDRVVRRFRIRRTRPLVATGPDRRVPTGSRVRLDARGSRAARGGRLRFRWSIVRRPRGSKAQLTGATGKRPTLLPDVRGRYRLRLRVVEHGGRRGRKAQASQLQPLTSASTIEILAPALTPPIGYPVATIPAPGAGIQIAGTTYAPSTNWVQVLTLDRATLEPKDVPHLALPQANHPGPGRYAFNRGDASNLRNLLNGSASGIDASYLVAMTGGGRAGQLDKPSWQALTYAFKQLGGTMDPFLNSGNGNSDPGFGSGAWSIVGIPGLTEGYAAQNWGLAPAGGQPAGSLQGRLAWDSQKQFTFIAGDYRGFNTNSTNQSAAAGGTNVMQVDDASYRSSTLGPGQSGFHVVTLDAGTLALVRNETFVTNDGASQSTEALQQMAASLSASASKSRYVVVLVQSIGAPHPTTTTWTGSLASAIGRVGGTSDLFNSLATGPKYGYSLVGGTGVEPTEAAENALNPENPTLAPPPAHLQGTLKRSDQYAFQAALTGPFVPNTNGFDVSAPQLAFRPSSVDWPTHDTPAHRAAEDYIARKIFYSDIPARQRGYDLHDYYWYADWQHSATAYSSALEEVCPSSGSPKPPLGAPFTVDDLQLVCAQVHREFTWVESVWGMTDAVQGAFIQQEITGPESASSVATALANAINKQRSGNPVSELVADVLLVEGTLLEAASEVIFAIPGDSKEPTSDLPALAATMGTMSGIFDLAGDLANTDSGQPVLANFDTEAKHLGFELQARYKNAAAAAVKLAELLVSDYGKLSIAGPKTLDPNGWGYGADRLTAFQDSVELSTTRYLWSKLLPGPYKVYNLGPGGRRWLQAQGGSWTPKSYRCYNNDNGLPGGIIIRPWRETPASGWVNQTVSVRNGKPYRQPNVLAGARFEFAGTTGANNTVEYYPGAPVPKSISDPLFKPVVYDQFSDTSSTVLKQVGMNKPEFFSTSQGLFKRVNVRC